MPPATAALFDNLTFDGRGHVLVQEDPGNTPYIAKTWDIDPQTGTAVQIFESDRTRFQGPAALTLDEESSGIVEITMSFDRRAGLMPPGATTLPTCRHITRSPASSSRESSCT